MNLNLTKTSSETTPDVNTLSFNTSGIDSEGVLAQLVATAHANVSHLSSIESSSPES